MTLTGKHTFIGFGFGAIQAGLFLYEAYQSGNFARLVVAEVVPALVQAVDAAGGMYCCNIAHHDRVEQACIGPVEIYDPATETGRKQLVEAVAEANEISTAIPSVKFYASEGPGSIHRLLAAGLRLKASRDLPPAVVYAAENHNHAAEILRDLVEKEIPAGELAAVQVKVQWLNTVIGKMSGVVNDTEQIRQMALQTVTPGYPNAFLVEAFNHILVSRVEHTPGTAWQTYQRGITVLQEKADLLPFEEAKLFGHNATHALAAYVGGLKGYDTIASMRNDTDLIGFLRDAFILESGEALIRSHHGIDPLFTLPGYTAYADDLILRMLNPFLKDTIERVGRDPVRKLGWDDRLVGTLRMALKQGVEPRRYAFGAAAALSLFVNLDSSPSSELRSVLTNLWTESQPDLREEQQVIQRIQTAWELVKRWKDNQYNSLRNLFK